MSISLNENAPSATFKTSTIIFNNNLVADDYFSRIWSIDEDLTSLSSADSTTCEYADDSDVATPPIPRRRRRKTIDSVAASSRSNPANKPYNCPYCRRDYCTERSLRVHLLSHEPGGRRHACPECPRTFSARGYLKLHMRAHNRRRRSAVVVAPDSSSCRNGRTSDCSISSSSDSSFVGLASSPMCINDDSACCSNLSASSAMSKSCDSRTMGDELLLDDDAVCDEVFSKLMRNNEIDHSSLIAIDFYSF